jgi:hypothetical protein
MIRIITITNPIDVQRDRRTADVDTLGHNLCQVLLYHFAAAVARPVDGEEITALFDVWAADYVASVNGHVWPRSLWDQVTPRDGDTIVLFPVVAGGSLLRTLASVALLAGTIALAASGAGAFVGAFLSAAISANVTAAIGTSILVGAAQIAGNLLISAVLGKNTPSNKSASGSYDPDGPQTLARSGTVIPKGYGTMLWGGNIIASFTEIDGSDQWVNVLVCFGFGPARSIRQVQINGKPIYEYQNCSYYTRLGTNDQTELAQFNQISNGYPQDTQCLAGIPVVVPGTGDQTRALQVDISYPSGIFVNTNDGNIIPAVITWLLEYQLDGSLEWQQAIQPQTTADVVQFNPNGSAYFPNSWGVVATDLPTGSNVVYDVDNGPHNPGDKWTGNITVETFAPNGNHSTYTTTRQGEWQLLDINVNYVYVLTWTSGYQDVVFAQTTPCYSRSTILGLAPGKYNVRITKYGSARLHDDVYFGDNYSPNVGQDMWVHSVNEITYQDLAYPNMVLIGVRALATSQLSGSGIKVTALIEHGLRTLDTGVLPAALQQFEEDNPACVAADMLLDDLYGGGAWPGITPTNLERFIDEWVAWAEASDALVPDGNGGNVRLCQFAGVFDNEDNLWNQVTRVGGISRAGIVQMGLDYGVFLDGPVDAPVQMFTVGNILQDSFTETWLPIDDRANQVEVQFADQTRYYKADNPLVYMDTAQQDAGVVVKNSRINALGITLPARVWHFARYKQRSTEFLLRSGSFRTDTDGIACRPGNVIALQHDVPQWGYGGRTLPGSSTTRLVLDRNDVPFDTATSYSVVVQHAVVQRYTGTVTGGSLVPGVGAVLTLSGFDGDQRVTRIVFADGSDHLVLASAAGTVTIPEPATVPIGGGGTLVYIPPTGGYTLFDTDVMETVGVTGLSAAGCPPGTIAALLAAPLSQPPDDFGLYIYGAAGAVKWVRVTRITKASEFRSTIEWVDYDASIYDVATPVIGETSAQVTSNPGVTSLTGAEGFKLVAGSYASYANLSWQPGPNTAGVAIYAQFVGTTKVQPTLVQRVIGANTVQLPVSPGTTVQYTAVGFDADGNYAGLGTAPTVTIAAVGVATNLLLGSSFSSGFAYWSISPRAGDTFAPQFDDDGQAVYTVAGTALTAPQQLCFQQVPATKWSVGGLLMLSGYVMDSAAVSTAPNAGSVSLGIVFVNAGGNPISTAQVLAPLSGVQPTLTRFNTAAVAVPVGTAAVFVQIALAGSSLSVKVGSAITVSHLLLEAAETGQTTPSAWADIDANGNILDLFTSGSSTGLRVQGSVLPSFTGSFSQTGTSTTLTLGWSNLVILWPDGAYTIIPDGTLAISGLTPSTTYYAYLYFDIINGGVKAAAPATALGTPNALWPAISANADAACKQDGRVALTPGGYAVVTSASGGSGGGGGGGGGGSNPDPILPVGPVRVSTE